MPNNSSLPGLNFSLYFSLCLKRGLLARAKKEAGKNRKARRGLWRMEMNAWNDIHGIDLRFR